MPTCRRPNSRKPTWSQRPHDRGDSMTTGTPSRPPLTDAVSQLVAAGERHFGVVPLVLVAAGHAKGDIPAALAREQQRHPGICYCYGRPLGPHPTLLALLAERLDAVLPPGAAADTTVLLVGRGSTDPDANAEIAKVARLLWEGRGIGAVEFAFVSLAEPGVPAALERCRRLGAERIVVLPYFLLPGVLPDRVVEQAATYALGHPELDVRCGGLIGASASLAPIRPPQRTSSSGWPSAYVAACSTTRSGSTPGSRKYGSTTIRSAPNRRQRSRAAGTPGSARLTKANSTAPMPRPSQSNLATL